MVKEEETPKDKEIKPGKLLYRDLKELTGDDVLFAGFTSHCNLHALADDDETPFTTKKEFKIKLEEFKKQKIVLGE
jgi:hypothetical protein